MNKNYKRIIASLILTTTLFTTGCSFFVPNEPETNVVSVGTVGGEYKVSQEEKDYLKKRFDELSTINKETIAYVYAPGTRLDEPVVQTQDNYTYLNYTFEKEYDPLMGTVFMDTENKKDFSNKLTWLFGHARGIWGGDNRMFRDVNLYDKQDYFNEHPYVVIETPERKYYYEAAFLIIVPETTSFYRTDFDETNKEEFVEQLTKVREGATTSNPNVSLNSEDNYLVLSTCREEDVTIRSNLYLRQIPDSELNEFLSKNKDKLAYQKTR